MALKEIVWPLDQRTNISWLFFKRSQPNLRSSNTRRHNCIDPFPVLLQGNDTRNNICLSQYSAPGANSKIFPENKLAPIRTELREVLKQFLDQSPLM